MELGNAASTHADITAQDVTLLANQTLMVTIINGINGINGTNDINGTNGINDINGTNDTNGTNGSNGVLTASVVDETTH